MTSSLVGSEMCIRDSSDHAPVMADVWVHQDGRQPRGPGGRGRGPWAPVSYTHLTLPTICSV
eukprot:1564628-Prorocentrum_lima.AAC.1